MLASESLYFLGHRLLAENYFVLAPYSLQVGNYLLLAAPFQFCLS